jgi:hypothetical protein
MRGEYSQVHFFSFSLSSDTVLLALQQYWIWFFIKHKDANSFAMVQ